MTIVKWNVDLAHSNIDFSIRHMMISRVKGAFNQYSGTLEGDPTDLTNASVGFNVDVDSIDTGNEDRDNHLRSGDFFDVENHPNMLFASTEIVKKAEDEYEVIGNLTLHGVTQRETFTVVFEGQATDPYGNEKVGFNAEGKISRRKYGLTWNDTLETGGVVVSDDVKISLDVQFAKEA